MNKLTNLLANTRSIKDLPHSITGQIPLPSQEQEPQQKDLSFSLFGEHLQREKPSTSVEEISTWQWFLSCLSSFLLYYIGTPLPYMEPLCPFKETIGLAGERLLLTDVLQKEIQETLLRTPTQQDIQDLSAKLLEKVKNQNSYHFLLPLANQALLTINKEKKELLIISGDNKTADTLLSYDVQGDKIAAKETQIRRFSLTEQEIQDDRLIPLLAELTIKLKTKEIPQDSSTLSNLLQTLQAKEQSLPFLKPFFKKISALDSAEKLASTSLYYELLLQTMNEGVDPEEAVKAYKTTNYLFKKTQLETLEKSLDSPGISKKELESYLLSSSPIHNFLRSSKKMQDMGLLTEEELQEAKKTFQRMQEKVQTSLKEFIPLEKILKLQELLNLQEKERFFSTEDSLACENLLDTVFQTIEKYAEEDDKTLLQAMNLGKKFAAIFEKSGLKDQLPLQELQKEILLPILMKHRKQLEELIPQINDLHKQITTKSFLLHIDSSSIARSIQTVQIERKVETKVESSTPSFHEEAVENLFSEWEKEWPILEGSHIYTGDKEKNPIKKEILEKAIFENPPHHFERKLSLPQTPKELLSFCKQLLANRECLEAAKSLLQNNYYSSSLTRTSSYDQILFDAKMDLSPNTYNNTIVQPLLSSKIPFFSLPIAFQTQQDIQNHLEKTLIWNQIPEEERAELCATLEKLSSYSVAPIAAPKTPEELKSFLRELYDNTLNLKYTLKQNRLAIDYCSKMLAPLPLPERDESGIPKPSPFFDAIPQDDREEIFSLLYKIQSNLVDNYGYHSDNAPAAALDETLYQKVLSTHAILAIGDYLARKNPENKLSDYPLSFAWLLDEIHSPRFVCSTPEMIGLHQKVLRYCLPNYHVGLKGGEVTAKPIFTLRPSLHRSLCYAIPEHYLHYIEQFIPSSPTLDKTLHLLSTSFVSYSSFLTNKPEDNHAIPKEARILQNLALTAESTLLPPTENGNTLSRDEFSFDPNKNFSITTIAENEFLSSVPLLNPSASEIASRKEKENSSSFPSRDFLFSLASKAACVFKLQLQDKKEQPTTTDLKNQRTHNSTPFYKPWMDLASRFLPVLKSVTLEVTEDPYEDRLKLGEQIFVEKNPSLQRLSEPLLSEFFLIPSNPFDEVNQALIFAEKTLHCLADPFFHNQLLHHIFKPGRLKAALEQDSQLPKRMLAFFSTWVSHFQELQNEKATQVALASMEKVRLALVELNAITSTSEWDVFLKDLIQTEEEQQIRKQKTPTIVSTLAPEHPLAKLFSPFTSQEKNRVEVQETDSSFQFMLSSSLSFSIKKSKETPETSYSLSSLFHYLFSSYLQAPHVACNVLVESDNFAGYFVSNLPPPDLVCADTAGSYLVLKNEKGKTKVLYKKPSLLQDNYVCLNFLSDDSIAPTNSLQESLILSHLYKKKGDLQQALNILPKNSMQYTSAETELLLRLQQHYFEAKGDVQNPLYGLTLYAMLLNNQETFLGSSSLEKGAAQEAYYQVSKEKNNLRDVFLEPLQEKILIRYVNKQESSPDVFGLGTYLSKIFDLITASSSKSLLQRKADSLSSSSIYGGSTVFVKYDKKNFITTVLNRLFNHSLDIESPSMDFCSLLKETPLSLAEIDALFEQRIWSSVDFKKHFISWYEVAKSADTEKRTKLLSKLQSNKCWVKEEEKPYVLLLESVCMDPSKYPDVPEDRNDGTIFAAALEEITNDFFSFSWLGLSYRIFLLGLELFPQLPLYLFRSQIAVPLYESVQRLITPRITVPFLSYTEAVTQKQQVTPLLFPTHLQTIDEEYNLFLQGLISSSEELKNRAADSLLDPNTLPSNPSYNRIKEGITKYNKTIRPTTRLVQSDKKNVLSAKIAAAELDLSKKKEQLLLKANAFLAEDIEALSKNQKVSIEQLQALLACGTVEAFAEKTGLTPSATQEVASLLLEYLVIHTRVEQLKRIQKELSLLETIDKQKDPSSYRASLENISSLLQQKRGYDITFENRFFLLFENIRPFLFRKEQTEKIHDITTEVLEHSAQVLAQMRTGFGKTDVVIPSALKILATDLKQKKKRLTVAIFPAPLIGPNFQSTQNHFSKAFGERTSFLQFNREMKLSPEGVQHIYEELLQNIQNDTTVVMTSESARAIQIQYLLHLEQASKGIDKATSLKIAAQLRNILGLLRESSAFVDEADKEFEPKKEVQWPFLNKRRMTKEEISGIYSLFKHLPKNIQELIQTNTFCYHPNLLEEMKKELLTYFLSALEVNNKDAALFEEFVFNNTEEIPACFKKDSKYSLAKGLAQVLLPNAFSGAVNTNYGLSKKHAGRVLYAIPYEAGRPKENEINPAQYKNPHETLVKTYITYIHNGLEKTHIMAVLRKFRSELEMELTEEKSSLPYLEFKQFFPAFTGGIRGKSDAELAELAEELLQKKGNNLDLILYFVDLFVAPTILTYEESLLSNGQNLRSMFGSQISMTASPQDPKALHQNTYPLLMPEVIGQFYTLLCNKCALPMQGDAPIQVIDGTSSEDYLHSVSKYVKTHPTIKAIIDEGGLFKGLNVQEILAVLRKDLRLSDKKEIVYFDKEANDFLAIDVQTGEKTPYHLSEKDPKHRFVFYDQSHIIGSDIVLPNTEDTKACVLLGHDSTLTSAQQASGRLRHLQDKQSLCLLLPNNLKNMMQSATHTPSIAEIVNFLVTKEEKRARQYNFDSLKQQMNDTVRNYLMDKLLHLEKFTTDGNKNFSIEKALSLYVDYRQEFVLQMSSDPILLYASLHTSREVQKALANYRKACCHRIDLLPHLSNQEKEDLKSRIRAIEQEKNIPLPERVSDATGMDISQDVQQEQQQEMGEEQQNEVNLPPLPKRAEHFWSYDLDLFSNANWIPATKALLEQNAPSSFSISSVLSYIDSKLFFGTISPLLFPEKPRSLLDISLFNLTDVINPILSGNKTQGQQKLSFPSDLLVTSNVWDALNERTVNPYGEHLPDKPFSETQKPIQNLLVIKEKEKTRIVLIDQKESEYFMRRIYEHKKADTDTVSIGIYNLSVGSFTAQTAGMTLSDTDAAFCKNIADAKVIAGLYGKLKPQELPFFKDKVKMLKELSSHQTRYAQKEFKKFLAQLNIQDNTK